MLATQRTHGPCVPTRGDGWLINWVEQTSELFCYLYRSNFNIRITANMNPYLLKDIKTYLSSMPIDRAWIFGSFARGDENENSDLDILVEFTKGVKLGFKYFHFINDLEAISRRKIDLVELSTLDPYVIPYVNQDKILIYERTA